MERSQIVTFIACLKQSFRGNEYLNSLQKGTTISDFNILIHLILVLKI